MSQNSSFDLHLIEENALSSLKNFQLATVEQIDKLYRKHQNKILVADEVGLGKTVVARGVIAKTARLRIEEGDDLFKVVYVCSNQSIAKQNISKLDICSGSHKKSVEEKKAKKDRDDISELRLSMQHLRVTEDENDENIRNKYIQLIPLTPETSFKVSGGGTACERALMAVVLSYIKGYSLKRMKKILQGKKSKADDWELLVEKYRMRVIACQRKTRGEYPGWMVKKLSVDERVKESILNLTRLSKNRSKSKEHIKQKTKQQTDAIRTLRQIFAEYSAEMLNPDLVIMDEFQRYSYLIKGGAEESECNILAQRFLFNKKQKCRVLLLSATPFKFFETKIEKKNKKKETKGKVKDSYAEFLDLLDFLFEKDSGEVKQVWKSYSDFLDKIADYGINVVIPQKEKAQKALYGGMLRTERITVMDSSDYIKDVKQVLNVDKDDIAAYVDFSQRIREIGLTENLPVEYAKSCPYLFSFMSGYKLKDWIEKCDGIKKKFESLKDIRGKTNLWIKRKIIKNYKSLNVKHARLDFLKEHAFMNQAKYYLWVPPTKSYYPLTGVYKDNGIGNESFSKIIVFSALTMVPRMIAALLSYEAERQTIAELRPKKIDGKKKIDYFTETKKHSGRLRFACEKGVPSSMSIFNILYPSSYLANTFNPVLILKDGNTLKELEERIKPTIREKIRELKQYENREYGVDSRWDYLLPMLMDGVEVAKKWANDVFLQSLANTSERNVEEADSESSLDDKKNIELYRNKILDDIQDFEEGRLGQMPPVEDLCSIMVDMAIGSPAVCAYRTTNGNIENATELALVFRNVFNSPIATAVVELATNRFESQDVHWRNVLRYCKDGCFQAMLDEYKAVLKDDVSFYPKEEQDAALHNKMCESLSLRTGSISADTFDAMYNRIFRSKKKKNDDERKDDENKQIRFKTHYAVSFLKTKSENDQAVSRKENVRAAFNSPLRPFVLASTSIGQEGLDFHPYCRKIFHWNLPGNPIDLEQREGRINRYKCLAVRQNVADSFDIKKEKLGDDLWDSMFAAAEERERAPEESELVPFWCFGPKQTTQIERILPLYPISRDEIRYEKLKKVLSMYRATFGHPHQEETIYSIMQSIGKDNKSKVKELFINLSPFDHNKKK